MFPSNNRVKLNRVTLKDVVSLKLAPRRRKPPKAAIDTSPDSSKQCRNVLSNSLPMEETAFVFDDKNESSQTVKEPKCLEKQNDALKERLQKKDTQKAKRRNELQSCKGDETECKRSGPNTRAGRNKGMICSVGGKDGQNSEKAEPAGGNPGSAAALGGQMPAGTPPQPSGPANFIQNIHLSPSEPAGSERCLRRASLCFVCGECKYISPRRRNLGKQEPKSCTLNSGPPSAMVKVYSGKSAVETMEKIIVWINEYPKVTLCDIAARCVVCSHNCGYILPDDLKNKKMRCFKRDMRAGLRIWPSCVEHNKHDSEQGAEAKNSTSSPSVQSGNSICQAESLREQHKHPEEGTAPDASKRFYNGWTDAGNAIPASFLKGKHTDEDEIRTWTLDHQDHAELGSEMTALEIRRDKRMKLGDGVECSRACSSALKENDVISRPDQNIFDPTESNVPQMSPDLFNENDEVNIDEPESFTCQRVRPYFRELRSSCARTYKSWPFSNSQPRCKDASATACSETGSSPKRTSDSITGYPNLPSSSTGENHNVTNLRTIQRPVRSPPRLEPFDASSFNLKHLCNITRENCTEADSVEFLLPPVLSPITSPYRHILGRTSFQSQSSLEDTEEVMNKDETPPDFYLPQVVNGYTETSCNSPEYHSKDMEGVPTNLSIPTDIAAFKSMSSASNTEVGSDGEKKGTIDDSDSEDGKSSSEQVSLGSEIQATVDSNVDSEEHASVSDEEEQSSATEEESSSSNIEGDEREAREAEERQSAILDEFTAYEHDILLVDIMQEDPELFENLPEKSLLNLGPVRDTVAPKKLPIPAIKLSSKTTRSSSVFEQRLTPVTIDLHDDGAEIAEEERESRPWRPRCTKNQSSYPVEGRYDGNNNKIESNGRLNQTLSFSHSISSPMALRTGPSMKNPANVMDFRRQKSNEYCRQYFSESLSCGFKMCRFQHLPAEGDEKFCVETVAKFAKNPACLQRAGAVFTGYYQNSPPGVYFSMPVVLTLLWALLKAGMVSNVFSVLRVSLAHNIVPGHDFLLALFNYVRNKDLMSFVPELMQLTFKMASVGLELSLDCIDIVKNNPMFQQLAHHNSHVALVGNQNSSACTPSPEYLNLVHGIVEIELCAKQEDWKRMGEVYRSVCQFSQHPNQVERISGRIAIALLSESKDKVSLPFTSFAETVCQNEGEESLVKSFVGRIGVSLMLRYHKNHHWVKGRRVVEVMSTLKVNYTALKSLFGNEDGASRCCLITVAAELFLLSGSVEGALNTLREHNWFLSSGSWPCEPADLESRTNVLRHLAGKTSHRDTLEVLCNLPGVKEPSDLIDISRYSPLFTSHLQVCVERQILPVASDLLDFMLCKKLAVDHSLLQTLLEKLGRQNLWLRAREVFKHSLSVGYYPEVSAPPGSLALVVPCQLGEVELALTLEMFVAFNASVILPLSDTATSSLSITLKRTQSCEGEYISAGNRLLSAACLPQPKLIVRYTAVNSSQEQVFRLDVSSARRWLRHNHLWASEMWTQRPKYLNPN